MRFKAILDDLQYTKDYTTEFHKMSIKCIENALESKF